MSASLHKLLNQYRSHSHSEFEKGKYFENLVKVFLENDDVQAQEYDKVWLFNDWAAEQGINQRDIGIDLVARHTDGSGFCAIQCKFYASHHSIQKSDIDSFIAASAREEFVSLVLIDTTTKELSPNAQNVLENLDRSFHRIALYDLENSRIDWSAYFQDKSVVLSAKKELRPHQREALDAVKAGLAEADRGKLIMACGTGKTFTGLKIAEELGGSGKLVLFMVPSLALMSQSVREWKNDCAEDFLAFSVCSDVKVGKRQNNDDGLNFNVNDLAFPATTKPDRISEQVSNADRSKMVVVFSTYQSINAISDAQTKHGLPEFDLIICDEAHRTTGVTLEGDDESNFVRIHSNAHVRGKKRLYMTATPKVFGDGAKSKAKSYDAELSSMDDEKIYGETLFYRGFSWAVENNLLSDYKVIVLAVDEGLISSGVQGRLSEANELQLDDASKIIGCYKALTKQNLIGEENESPKQMKRALAFCKNIKISKGITHEFAEVVGEFITAETNDENAEPSLLIETSHVDGTYNAKQREECLEWLKSDTPDDVCRILSNARCLSEGVDVPSLDAIMFLHPRKSVIDVIQSVGRVMRRAEGKEMGYVILPVAIPAGVKPEDSLNDNERYKVVWQILNALRAHDDRFDAMVNQASLGENISSKIEIVGITSTELASTTAVVGDIDVNKRKALDVSGIGQGDGGPSDNEVSEPVRAHPEQIGFVFDELTQAIRAKIVERCGTREYWDTWAKDIAKIAEKHITRITTIVSNEGSDERTAFMAFLNEIRDDLNPEISENDAIEMLAQHLITKPVFDTLFVGNEFTKNNPVSRAMELVLEQLDHHNIGKEADSLQKFYESVKRRAEGIKTAHGRQTLVVELYDKFFRTAFPAMTQKLGIVYTPVEVVDFIIHSVNDVLQSEFGQTVGSKGVHILDPFTGTGTFITRLLQSGLIKPEELEHKYKNEIHANEIVLLAYYIAAINIEAVYHDMAKQNANGENVPYSPFEGIVLTDTFQLYEQDKDMVANLLPDNSERRTAQKECDVRVIVGNPPYSGGQKNANDDAANIAYTNLDTRISDTFVAESANEMGKSKAYDSYIRAIRWGSDRIGEAGILAYVSGGGWVEKNFADGMRKCLFEEASDLFLLNLRGDIRKNMLSKGAAKEGENIFGSGSMTSTVVVIQVKNPESSSEKSIHYLDIGDDLSRTEKLGMLSRIRSVLDEGQLAEWKTILPDQHNDWLGHRDQSFDKFWAISDKRKGKREKIFETYSMGVKSNRDAWVYSRSKADLSKKVFEMLETYNSEVDRLSGMSDAEIDASLNRDKTVIKWTTDVFGDLKKGLKFNFDQSNLQVASYRPFTKQWWYSDPSWNWTRHLFPRFVPNNNIQNRYIHISGTGARSGFSTLMAETTADVQHVDNGQCFPLKLYEPASADDGLFAAGETEYTQRDGISNSGLKHFQDAYPSETISKEDLFYYIYGLLHSSHYRERFKNNLSKELPRIPAVKKADDFWAFSKAGRELGNLHVNYETVEPYLVVIAEGDLRLADIADPEAYFRVEKMKFGGKGKNKDKSIVHYNQRITITQIPLEAYDYVVNGKPALEWVMERQCVKTDKASGIVNDANDYANETVGNPAYPFELFQRVITVSLETMKIVNNLPELDID